MIHFGFRLWRWLMVAATGGILSTGWVWAAPAARPPAWRLLPKTTALFVSVADAPDIVGRFQTTALGQMIQDPQVEPLVQHLYGSLVGAAATVQDRLGMTLPELLSIPQGELTVAVVVPEKSVAPRPSKSPTPKRPRRRWPEPG